MVNQTVQMKSLLQNIARRTSRHIVLNESVLIPVALTGYHSQMRFNSNFPSGSVHSSSDWEEPEYGVTDNEEFNPAAVKISYLPDYVRQEMYKLYQSDPNVWTEKELSRKYGTSITRTRAVLLLMQRREELRNRLLGTTDGSVPEHWKVVYEKHCEDREKYTPEALFQEFCVSSNSKPKTKAKVASAEVGNDSTEDPESEQSGEEGDDVEVVKEMDVSSMVSASGSVGSGQYASLFSSPAAIKDMLDRYEEHLIRSEDQEYYDQYMEQQMDVLREHGVNTSFRELRAGRDLSSITGFTPRLIGDDLDEFKLEMQRLKATVLSQTSAVPAKNAEDVDRELMTYEDKLKFAPDDAENRADVKFDHECRWKFAFKDTSQLRQSQPTMIRTRTGKLRPATPLEELGRSWYGKKPNFMDRKVLYEQKYHKYADPDGDEHILKTFQPNKAARNAALAKKIEKEQEERLARG